VTTKFPQLSKGQSALLNAIRKAGRAAAEAESDLDDVIEEEVGADLNAGLEAGFDVGGPRKFEKKMGLSSDLNRDVEAQAQRDAKKASEAKTKVSEELKSISLSDPEYRTSSENEVDAEVTFRKNPSVPPKPQVESPWASAERPFESNSNPESPESETEYLEMPETWNAESTPSGSSLIMEDEADAESSQTSWGAGSLPPERDSENSNSHAQGAEKESPAWGKMPETTEFEQLERLQDDMLKLARKGLTPAEISQRLRISQDQVALFLRSRRERGV
jgi:hypothetical protein